jgi:hypothetical protein
MNVLNTRCRPLSIARWLACFPVYVLLTGFLALNPLWVSGQTFFPETAPAYHTCGTDALHRILMHNNPHYQAQQMQTDRAYHKVARTSKSKAQPEGPAVVYTIPVVVHVMHLPGTPVGSDENISAAQIRAGLQHLTEAFRKSHAEYDGMGHNKNIVGADVEFEFQLAKSDPAGKPTDGIVRVATALSNLNLDKPANDLALKDLSRWNTARYLNIWLVKEICYFSTNNCDIAAYASLPGAHGQPFDGLVQEAAFFGKSRLDSKMQIHEVGHYFNLLHTYEGGCANANCLTNGDQVCDTPPDNSVQPVLCGATIGVNSCTTDEQDVSVQNPYRPIANGGLGDQNDNYENFMDDGNRGCQTTFTAGQKVRMIAALTQTRGSLINGNLALTPATTSALAAFGDDGSTGSESSATRSLDCRTYVDVSIPILFYNAPTLPVTVQVGIAGGTAANAADFVLQTPSVMVPAGAVSANVTLRIFNDRAVETSETVILTLNGAAGNNGNTGIAPYNTQFTYVIFDNDVAPSGTPPVLFATNFTNNSGTGVGNNTFYPWIFGAFNAPPSTNVFRIANNGGTCTTGGSMYVTNNLVNQPNAFDDIESSPIAYRTIDATGYSDLTISYDIKVGGQAGLDRGRIYTRNLSAGATSFSLMPAYSNMHSIACATNTNIPLPAAFSNAVFDFAFNFTTTAGNGSVAPSLTIDNFQVTAPATPIGVNDKETATAYLGPLSTVHFVSATGRLLATIQNRSNHDYGCTTVIIDRAGTSAVSNGESYRYSSKTYAIDPANDNPGAGEYDITLYYTAAERNGWLAATNFTPETFYVSRSTGAIAAATDASTATRITTAAAYGADFGYTARFETGLSGKPGFSMASDNALPVEWLYFTAKKADKSVQLAWATASEYNHDYFKVERSGDGSDFISVATVKGRNGGQKQEIYELYDHQPLPGINYYRLTAIDRFGKADVAPLVAVSFEESTFMVIQPNPAPAHAPVTLVCQAVGSGSFTTEWMDANGRVCKRMALQMERGTNRFDVPTDDLQAGLYFVRLQDESGAIVSTVRFMKL